MNIIIPMAGMGKRMRPHTLTTPKPLLAIAGKSIVARLVENLTEICDMPIENIGFVTGRFGDQAEAGLMEIAAQAGAVGHIYYQDEALGTAHAIHCAKALLEGNTIIAFADTLFSANFKIDPQADGVIWVKEVEDPSAFGVVELNAVKEIIGYVEKPTTWVSNLAMIGIYYVKEGKNLKTEIDDLLAKKIMHQGEYQLPDVFRNMTQKGYAFVIGKIDQWFDCGNKNATVSTNVSVLDIEMKKGNTLVDESVILQNSIVIEPCYIGPGVVITNSVIGPGVSISTHTEIENSVISNAIIYSHTQIKNKSISNSMIGHHVKLEDMYENLNIGDYCG